MIPIGGYAEEVRSVRGGASPAGGGASRERRHLLQVGWLLLEGGCRNLLEGCFSMREGVERDF